MFRFKIIIILFLFFKINTQAQITADKKKSYDLQDSLFKKLPPLYSQNDLKLLELSKIFEVDFLLDKMENNNNSRHGKSVYLLRVLNQDSLDQRIAAQLYSENDYIRSAVVHQLGLSENPKMIPLLFSAFDSLGDRNILSNLFGLNPFRVIQSAKGITHPNAIPFLEKYLLTIPHNYKYQLNLKEEVPATVEFIKFFNTSSKEDIFNQLMKNRNDSKWILSKIIRTNDKDYLPLLQKHKLKNKFNSVIKYQIITARLKLKDLTITEEEKLFYALYPFIKIKRKKVKRKYK